MVNPKNCGGKSWWESLLLNGDKKWGFHGHGTWWFIPRIVGYQPWLFQWDKWGQVVHSKNWGELTHLRFVGSSPPSNQLGIEHSAWNSYLLKSMISPLKCHFWMGFSIAMFDYQKVTNTYTITHRIHVWNIYLHLPQKCPKCSLIFHTWSIWVILHTVFLVADHFADIQKWMGKRGPTVIAVTKWRRKKRPCLARLEQLCGGSTGTCWEFKALYALTDCRDVSRIYSYFSWERPSREWNSANWQSGCHRCPSPSGWFMNGEL